MKRKIYNKLLEWKESSHGRTAILIDGARRIGKSWIVEEFAKNEYKSYLLVDFNNPREGTIELFERGFGNLDTFFSELSLLYDITLYPNDSLLIFDEVQLYPKARAAIKYLVKDGRYHYIQTGSLMSINHNVANILIPSEERRIEMYPMDFEEFMWAVDQAPFYQHIKNCFIEKRSLGNALHRKAMGLLRAYILTGGMPQALAEYIATQDFREVDNIKRDILALYRNDISKYARRQAAKVSMIFDHIPAALKQPIKKLSPSKLKKDGRMRDFSDAIFWLNESRVANFCYAATEPNIGLNLTPDSSKAKVYLGDTGLLISMAFTAEQLAKEGVYKKILLDKLEFNQGMIVENYVAQQLKASGHSLFFYYDSEKRVEIDFLINKPIVTSRHNMVPIEVKSSTRYTTSSLNKFRDQFSRFIYDSIIFHTGDLEIHEQVTYLPLYMATLV